jgi:hypothetical protein
VVVLVLVTVIVCAAEVVPTFVAAKVRLLGENETVANEAPVPVSVVVCGEFDALAFAARLAVAVPAAAGLNAIDSVQLAPAASDVRQVFPVSTNSLALVPVNRKDLAVNAVVPVLVSVAVCTAEVEPNAVAGKVRLLGVSVAVAATGVVPVSVTICGEPGALSVAARLAIAVPAASA